MLFACLKLPLGPRLFVLNPGGQNSQLPLRNPKLALLQSFPDLWDLLLRAGSPVALLMVGFPLDWLNCSA